MPSNEAIQAILQAQSDQTSSRWYRVRSEELHKELREEDFVTLVENLLRGRK